MHEPRTVARILFWVIALGLVPIGIRWLVDGRWIVGIGAFITSAAAIDALCDEWQARR